MTRREFRTRLRSVDTGVHCDGSGVRGHRAICPNTHVACGTCGRILLCDDYADRVPDHTAIRREETPDAG